MTRRLLKRPVLILGRVPRMTVIIARSLHRHGVPVDVATFDSGPALGSRAIREVRKVPSPALDPAGFVERLGDFIRRGGHDMVIPVDDQSLMAIGEHYDALKDLALIGCPRPEITSQVLDKSQTLAVAERCGIRIPPTKLISTSAQLPELASAFPFPWVLKPAKKQLTVEEHKSFTIAMPDQIPLRFPAVQEFVPPMLLQEYCPGAGVGIEALIHEGECVAVFQHRRLKEFPYGGGYSVTAVAERPDPLLVEKSLALLRALGWEGPAMVEFKVNPNNGTAVFMEVNGRYWGSIGLPILAGIDFPLYHWQLLHGEFPIVPKNYTDGVGWRWTAGHVLRIHELLILASRSSSARKELLSYVQPPVRVHDSEEDPLMIPSDPMPAILDLLTAFGYVCSYDWHALRRRFSPSH